MNFVLPDFPEGHDFTVESYEDSVIDTKNKDSSCEVERHVPCAGDAALKEETKPVEVKHEEPKEPTREELAAMSDEDWAKGVLPDDKDAEGHEIDRTFMTNMAKVCREAGISPKMMQKMSGRFQELAKAEMQKQDAARAEQQKQLDAANAAATKAAIEKFDDRQWEDIRAAGAKYIPAGSELAKLMEGPLGSNVELLSILNVVGKSLRSAAPDATGAAGSGEHDAGLAVALKTVRPGVLD